MTGSQTVRAASRELEREIVVQVPDDRSMAKKTPDDEVDQDMTHDDYKVFFSLLHRIVNDKLITLTRDRRRLLEQVALRHDGYDQLEEFIEIFRK